MSIHLAQALHARWAADTNLNNLLPAHRVFTGEQAMGMPAAPWGAILLLGGTLESAANDGSSVDRMKIRIQLRHDDYDQGQAIIEAVLTAFDRSDFSLEGRCRVISMQREGLPQEFLDPQHVRWTWFADFECRVSVQ